MNSATYTLLNVRQDWLDKLGLTVPKTVDDVYKVAYAFTYNDPDGNGKNDTIGYSGKAPYGFEPIANAYDTALGNYIIVRDGKVTNTLSQPHMPFPGYPQGVWEFRFLPLEVVWGEDHPV